MQALIIDKEADRLDQSLIELMKAGIHVTGTSSIKVAEICITRMCVDLLVIEKSSVGDALGDTLGMAEERNPYLVSVLRTADVPGDQDGLTPHFPSLHCVVGQDVSNSMALKIGLSSLRAQMNVALDQGSEIPVIQSYGESPRLPLSARPFAPQGLLAEAS